jgi:flagellar basal-body rod protein FlgG
MIKAMRTAASGMTAQQMNVDNIANNLANVNTTGFKRSKLEFQDVLYKSLRKAGASATAGTQVPTSLEVGYGTRPVATVRQFEVGEFTQTGSPLDMAIEGNGFFQVTLPDGTTGFTRDGSFKMSSEGQITTSDGLFLSPEITIPEDAEAIQIGYDGMVFAIVVGSTEPQELGQIETAKFVNPAGLEALGHNLFAQTVASGEPITGIPGEEGLGTIAQGYLEMSNVDVVAEMVNMIVAQRAYEVNSKAIQTSEEMSSIANSLKR